MPNLYNNPVTGAAIHGLGGAALVAIGASIRENDVHDEAITMLIGGLITGGMSGLIKLGMPNSEDRSASYVLYNCVVLVDSLLTIAASLTAPLMGEEIMHMDTKWGRIIVDDLIGALCIVVILTPCICCAACCGATFVCCDSLDIDSDDFELGRRQESDVRQTTASNNTWQFFSSSIFRSNPNENSTQNVSPAEAVATAQVAIPIAEEVVASEVTYNNPPSTAPTAPSAPSK